jgi:hypothetical protein
MVGQPRNGVAQPGMPTAADPGGRAVARGTPAPDANRDAAQRSFAGGGIQDRTATPSRTAPRADSQNRPIASSPAYGAAMERSRPAPSAGNTTTYTADSYARRAPAPNGADDPRSDNEVRGRATPRAYPSYGAYSARPSEVPRPRPADGPGSIMIPRTAPESVRPAAPDYRPYGYGIERRGPGVDRPSGPPPAAAAPPPVREYRANPGAGAAPPPAPENRGGSSPAPQGHSRGGQPASGTAAPRGRG